MVFVFLTIVWKFFYEIFKLGLVIASMIRREIVVPLYTTNTIRSSPFVPCLYFVGIDVLAVVWQHKNDYHDDLIAFLVNGLSMQLPFAIITLVYFVDHDFNSICRIIF